MRSFEFKRHFGYLFPSLYFTRFSILPQLSYRFFNMRGKRLKIECLKCLLLSTREREHQFAHQWNEFHQNFNSLSVSEFGHTELPPHHLCIQDHHHLLRLILLAATISVCLSVSVGDLLFLLLSLRTN